MLRNSHYAPDFDATLGGRIQQFGPHSQLSPGEPRCGTCVTPGAQVSPRIVNMSTCSRGACLTRARSERLSASAQHRPRPLTPRR
jgi:hypothetical protein